MYVFDCRQRSGSWYHVPAWLAPALAWALTVFTCSTWDYWTTPEGL